MKFSASGAIDVALSRELYPIYGKSENKRRRRYKGGEKRVRKNDEWK